MLAALEAGSRTTGETEQFASETQSVFLLVDSRARISLFHIRTDCDPDGMPASSGLVGAGGFIKGDDQQSASREY